MLGEIRRFAQETFPSDWVACDGSLIPITDNQPLFSLLGWRFGGDGWTTFRIPTLQSINGSLNYAIAVNGIYPTRDGAMIEDVYVGEIRLFGGDYPPAGWLVCDGQALPIADPYTALYDVIGKRWGGDEEHFVLPDLRDVQGADGRVVRQLTYIIAAVGKRPESA